MLIKERKTCRVCGAKNLVPVLSLGEQYVTNFVDDPIENANKGPLELVLCDIKSGGCGLLQLRHTFDHDVLYRKYWYRGGMSTMMTAALGDIVKVAEKLVKLQKNDIIIDIGANDGTLLKQYDVNGLIKVGFEPSNLWEEAAAGNPNIIHDYFSYKEFAKKFPGKKARVITSIAMFYDLEDPNVFVEDIGKCLDKDGLWIIQMNYLGTMIENNTFDNISHEHLEYYSLFTLENLLKRHDLEAFDVELNDVNGGSFRIYVRHSGSKLAGNPGAEARLKKQRAYEKSMNFDSKEVYVKFAERIGNIGKKLREFLETQKKSGKRVFIYGASTRGLVILQFAGIDKNLIEAATDKSKDKWGKFIVGTGIPIISLEDYRKRKPDYLFVLPYHFVDEIREQEKDFITRGGKLIVAIPEFRVIGK